MIRPGLFLCGVAVMVASACAPAPAEMTDAERDAVETSARSAFEGIMGNIASADQDGLMSYVADGSIFAFHGMVWDRAGLASTLGDFYGSIARSDMARRPGAPVRRLRRSGRRLEKRRPKRPAGSGPPRGRGSWRS